MRTTVRQNRPGGIELSRLHRFAASLRRYRPHGVARGSDWLAVAQCLAQSGHYTDPLLPGATSMATKAAILAQLGQFYFGSRTPQMILKTAAVGESQIDLAASMDSALPLNGLLNLTYRIAPFDAPRTSHLCVGMLQYPVRQCFAAIFTALQHQPPEHTRWTIACLLTTQQWPRVWRLYPNPMPCLQNSPPRKLRLPLVSSPQAKPSPLPPGSRSRFQRSFPAVTPPSRQDYETGRATECGLPRSIKAGIQISSLHGYA